MICESPVLSKEFLEIFLSKLEDNNQEFDSAFLYKLQARLLSFVLLVVCLCCNAWPEAKAGVDSTPRSKLFSLELCWWAEDHDRYSLLYQRTELSEVWIYICHKLSPT